MQQRTFKKYPHPQEENVEESEASIGHSSHHGKGCNDDRRFGLCAV